METSSTSEQDIPSLSDTELGAAHDRDVARRASLADLRRVAAAIQQRGSSGTTDTPAVVHDAAVRGAREPDERHADDVAGLVAPGDAAADLSGPSVAVPPVVSPPAVAAVQR